MKLISFERSNGEHGFGALADNGKGVIDLGRRLGQGQQVADGLLDLLQGGRLDQARLVVQQVAGRAAAASSGDIGIDELRFDCPIRTTGENHLHRRELCRTQ